MLKIQKDLRKVANSEKAKLLQGFFKTGKGEYGEGDIFLGVIVPETRKIAIKYRHLLLKDVELLLKSKIHEERLCALLILVHNYQHNPSSRLDIFNFYINSTKYINNWDLVDLSSHQIVGHFLYHFGKEYPLYKILLTDLAKSSNIWERRIAIISTFYFIKNEEYSESLKLAEMLLDDKHDLIHKAVGWMLREIGKADKNQLIYFLNKHYKRMPRTMLRYSIEKLPEKQRKGYLQGKV